MREYLKNAWVTRDGDTCRFSDKGLAKCRAKVKKWMRQNKDKCSDPAQLVVCCVHELNMLTGKHLVPEDLWEWAEEMF